MPARHGVRTLPNTALIRRRINPIGVGDCNNDGMFDNGDIDAFALALTDPPAWEQQYGIPGDVNRILSCDCNGDGKLDNTDIDAFVELILYSSGCGYPMCDEGDAPRNAGEANEDGWSHFWEVIEYLYAYFGA